VAISRSVQRLLFVDTNIWLDFYRARNETGLALLRHVEAIKDKVLATYQLESEFKTNRQTVIAESLKELKAIPPVARPGIFSDAQASKALISQMKEADKRIKALKAKFAKVLENPTKHDPVYQTCQRIFHRNSPLVLTRKNQIRHTIRRRAFRRFLHGCPPRKRGDVSIGDALNWEWMVHCANTQNAELVIVTRDSDYGLQLDGTSYINDHLRQEFSERVSQKRKILLYSKLSEALKHFEIPITAEEEMVEAEIISAPISAPLDQMEESSNLARAERLHANWDLVRQLIADLELKLRASGKLE
jgi:hypothetical protein